MYDVLLMLHFIGLAMGVGTSFAMLTLGSTARKLPPEERGVFFGRIGGLAKNGSIGFLLLIASGIGMLLERGASVMFRVGGGAFHVKLTLVVILAGALGYSQVLRKRLRESGGTGPAMSIVPKLGMAMLALGLGIIVTAVLAFH